MRTKFKFDYEGEPDFIFTADLHIRDTVPSCRTSSFLSEMIQKLRWLKELSDVWSGAPVLAAGDIFDTWRCKDWWLFNMAYKLLPDNFTCIAGQHELPRHSLKLPERSPLNILHEMERIHLISSGESLLHITDSGMSVGVVGKNWGDKVPPIAPEADRTILLNHEMVWHKTPPFPGAPEEGNASRVLSRYSDFDTIVCGDNHDPFTYVKEVPPKKILGTTEWSRRLLVNCGSMLRTNIGQRDFKPRVWLYYAEENYATPLYFPIQKSFIEYEDVSDEEDERIKAVVKRMSEGMDIDVSFEENVKRYLAKEKTSRRVTELLLEAIGE